MTAKPPPTTDAIPSFPHINPDLGIPPVPWCVCRTLPRREMNLARMLRSDHPDVPFLLPISPGRPRYPGEKARMALLFPGIIFIGASVLTNAAPGIPTSCLLPESPPPTSADRDRLLLDPTLDRVVSTRQASNFLFTGLQARLRRELLLLADPPSPISHGATPLAGTRVRIREGPFRDMEGMVEDVSPSGTVRLYIRLVLLGQPLSVEMDAYLLEQVC